MQSAEYYALTDNQPEENVLRIYTTGANRYYFYAPASLAQIETGDAKEHKDRYFSSKGIRGQRQYEISEISDSNPPSFPLQRNGF